MRIEHHQKLNDSRQKFLREYELLKVEINKKVLTKGVIDNSGFLIKLKRAFSSRL